MPAAEGQKTEKKTEMQKPAGMKYSWRVFHFYIRITEKQYTGKRRFNAGVLSACAAWRGRRDGQ